ncbi:hypothetical protein J2X31_001024 [Flavobacterium arsenatis]|uniref:DUF4369 domain-containing protein n=1 Tax=Flavobacterium arsenatis TaxID=1484332 RepID=A0ABU1TM26_9FLAO|nr:DUF4369 domain-containing protein [Flavobacterium arsenatis]MDR6967024.1 hypothetical protein [Flavobacterium arsenatis]
MKNAVVALFSIFLIISCSKKESDKNLHIIGNIKGLQEGKLYLQRIVDTNLVAIDSVILDGKSNFEWHLDIESPEMFYLFLDRGVTNSVDNNLPVFVEPGTINIETDLKRFFAEAKITGSKNQKLYEDYKKINARFTNQNLELSKERFDAIRFNRPSDVPAIEKKIESNLKRKYLYAINFAITNKDFDIAPYIALSEISDANIKYLDTINNALPESVAKAKYGKLLSKYIEDVKKVEK